MFTEIFKLLNKQSRKIYQHQKIYLKIYYSLKKHSHCEKIFPKYFRLIKKHCNIWELKWNSLIFPTALDFYTIENSINLRVFKSAWKNLWQFYDSKYLSSFRSRFPHRKKLMIFNSFYYLFNIYIVRLYQVHIIHSHDR